MAVATSVASAFPLPTTCCASPSAMAQDAVCPIITPRADRRKRRCPRYASTLTCCLMILPTVRRLQPHAHAIWVCVLPVRCASGSRALSALPTTCRAISRVGALRDERLAACDAWLCFQALARAFCVVVGRFAGCRAENASAFLHIATQRPSALVTDRVRLGFGFADLRDPRAEHRVHVKQSRYGCHR